MNFVALPSANLSQSARVHAKPVQKRACSLARPVQQRKQRLHVCAQDHAPSVGFFNDAFKNALSEALDRSSDDREDIFTAASKPKGPRMALPPMPSAQEDMLGAALEASKTTVSRLTAMKNELERALEREKMQVERLQFAVDKASKDEAYYRVLRIMQERGTGSMSDME